MDFKLAGQNLLWPGIGQTGIDYIAAPPADDYACRAPRRLAIMGSTGTIGSNSLDILDPAFFSVQALACGTNIQLLASQASRWRPPMLGVADESLVNGLRRLLPEDYNPSIFSGAAGFGKIASAPDVDCVLSCQSGAAGLPATLAACAAGKVIALANKESLVLAGGLIRKLAKSSHASILPVDSEHFAFFQCCAGRGNLPAQFLLTASGGPFRGKKAPELEKVTPAQALAHPNWKMGKKITIDSATLMNKGLELIEATQLFGIRQDRITVLVHPQSIVHSLVRFRDNSLLGQLSLPDMKLPIASCLYWPYALEGAVRPLDLLKTGPLVFEEPDYEAFQCLGLAREACAFEPDQAWREYGLNPACIVLNAANEIAVDLFLAEKCSFLDIPRLIKKCLDAFVYGPISLPMPDCAGETGFWQKGLCAIRHLEWQVREMPCWPKKGS